MYIIDFVRYLKELILLYLTGHTVNLIDLKKPKKLS